MNAAEITCAFTVVIERQIGKRWKGRKCSKGWGLRNAGCLFLIENDLLWKTLYKTIHHAFLSWFSLVWRVDICPSAGWLKLSRVFVGWLCVCVCVCACVRVCVCARGRGVRAWRAWRACARVRARGVCVACALISFRLSERAPVLKSLKRDVSRWVGLSVGLEVCLCLFLSWESDWGRLAALRRRFLI